MARRRTRLQSSVWMEMPREYSDHPICKQVGWSNSILDEWSVLMSEGEGLDAVKCIDESRWQLMTLKDEEALKDVAVVFGAAGGEERVSGFLLSLLSPVWRAKLCGNFRQGKRDRQLDLEVSEAEAVKMIIELGCGGGVRAMKGGLTELVDVGRVAERYQVEEVRRAVEEEVVRHLTLETCGGMLMACQNSGLREVEEACRRMALERFEELATTEGFMDIGEDMLRSIVEDERLACGTEEKVFEGVVRWMKRGEGCEVRGEGLLETIRFPLMSGYYLMTSARNALRGSERLERLVMEASGLQSVPACEWADNVKYLCRQALCKRVRRGVGWGEYGGGRGHPHMLAASSGEIFSLAEGGEWVCGGLSDGGISVWNKASLTAERTLTGHTRPVQALAMWERWLVSGSLDHDLKVWDVRGGHCVRTLQNGHTDQVFALAVGGGVLLSGSKDKTIKVWRLDGSPSAWTCERTLTGHKGSVFALVWRDRKGLSGCASGEIRVWDLSSGECVRTLRGHVKGVDSLLVTGDRLLSASRDGSVREWALEGGSAGSCVRVVEAYPAQTDKFIKYLVLSGEKLVGGSISLRSDASAEYEVVVWELRTLTEEWRLKLLAGQRVHALVAVGGEVWGGVARQAMVWGRK